MAGRHAGWRRLRGGADRPDLVKLGEKMLGYLTEQRRLSGVKTQEVSHRLPDGSAVRARWVGDQPIIEIQTASKADKKEPRWKGLRGIVVKPRNKGTASAGDGVNAYGLHGHVLVRVSANDDGPVASVWFYDAITAPPDVVDPQIYSQTRRGDALFTQGLASWCNNDWTDGTVTLTWTLWSSAGTEGPSRDFSSINGYSIFHNGRRLIDVSTTVPAFNDEDVVAACVRRWEGQDYLVFVISDGWKRLRTFRVAIAPDTSGDLLWVEDLELEDDRLAPLWVTVGAPVLVKDFSFSSTADHNDFDAYGAASFSRNAREFRTLRHVERFHPSHPGDFTKLVKEVYEIVGDFTDLDAVTFTQELVGQYGWYYTHTHDYPRIYSCWVNGYNAITELFNPEDWSGGSGTTLVGTGTTAFDFVRYGSGPVPVVVQYEGDTPVYMYYEPGTRLRSGTQEATFKNDMEITPTFKHFDSGFDRVASGNDTSSDTLFAVDKDGTRWWEVTVGTDRTVTTSYSMTAWNTYSDGAETGECFGGGSSSDISETDNLALWFVDLRSKSIIATTEHWRQELNETLLLEQQGEVSTQQAIVRKVEGSETVSDRSYRTEVWFYGVLVDSQEGNIHADSSSSTETFPGLVITPSDIWPNGGAGDVPFDALNDDVAINDEAYAAIPKDQPVAFDIESYIVVRDTTTTGTETPTVENLYFRHSQGAPISAEGYFTPSVDHEAQVWPTVLASSDGSYHFHCQAVAHDGMWAYSMPDVSALDGSVVPTQWVARCGHRGAPTSSLDLRSVVSRPEAELFATMWPISGCATSVIPSS